MDGNVRKGMERISSAPRLSFSSQDVFNLRNHNLSQLSRSSPGIYKPEMYGSEFKQQKVIYCPGTSMPKSILVKKEDSIPEIPIEEDKEGKQSYYAVQLELQFTAFVFICFVLVIVIPLSMIVMGSIYLYSCPIQVMIPIYLVVGGSTFLFSIVLLRKLKKLANNSKEDRSCYRSTFFAAFLFQVGWFIAGCYWTYGIYEPSYTNESNTLYCDKTLYLYSFWLLNAVFLSLSLFAILFAVYIIFGREQTLETGTKV